MLGEHPLVSVFVPLCKAEITQGGEALQASDVWKNESTYFEDINEKF